MNTEKIIRDYLSAQLTENWRIDYLLNHQNWILDNPCQQVVLLKDRLVFIDQNEKRVVQEKPLDEWGELYEIIQHGQDYIILGELNIVCLTSNYSVRWSFSARDIFVRKDNNSAFELYDDKIVAYDWLGWCYVLDYNGNLLSEAEVY